MGFQTLLDKVFSTWERDHHALFTRCIEACMGQDAVPYWACAARCHEYFNQTKPWDVELS